MVALEARERVLSDRIRVFVSTDDALSRAGICAQLRTIAGVDLVGEERLGEGTVGVVVAEQMDPATATSVRALRRRGVDRVVLVVSHLDDAGLLAATEAGVSGVMRRNEAGPANLAATVRTVAAGDGSLPPDLLGRLLDQMGQLQRHVLGPRGLTFSGLTEREVSVLRLLADGLDTAEVGRQLFYSERTVKNIVHDVTSRLDLRNRTHAVAYAIRQGLI